MRNTIQRIFVLAFSLWLIANFYNPALAKDITIIYTGETHAMLYPCSCPIEPDGGVARRATLIKQLKKNSPDTLVLDSGGFSAGGLLDEYTLNTQMDMQRTLVNLKAMELMGYDAVTLGDDEFNFGKAFLEDNINKSKIQFLSSNSKINKVVPFIIREVAGIKIGIIGVNNIAAAQKSEGINFTDPEDAVGEAVTLLKKDGVNIIVLLSHLGENDDLNLLRKVKGIDVVIIGHSRSNEGEIFSKADDVLILRPTWQGRRLGKVTFSVKDNKVINPKVEELRLSDKISDDAGILKILPRCFADVNCKKEGIMGNCQDAGSINARCTWPEVNKINLLIISSRTCLTCDTELIVKTLKKHYPGLVASTIYYPGKEAEDIVGEFKIEGLPAFLLGKEVEKEKNFESFKQSLEFRGGYYMLKPQVSGFALFLNRQKVKGKFDLFLSLLDKSAKATLDAVKDFNPAIHFLIVEKDGKLDAAGGAYEIEESLRAVCVQKYYPEYFRDYINCRAGNIGSSWWEDCLGKYSSDKIKVCAKSQEGTGLLKGNIALNKEMQVMFGPTYLVDNQEIFSSKGAPNKEELKKILKR